MEIKNAKYVEDKDGNKIGISCNFGDKVISAPIHASNRHYEEIMRQVKEGTITIKDAD